MPFTVEDDTLEVWHINNNDYTVDDHIIGQGKFGIVRVGEWRGSKVAIKCLFNNDDDMDKTMVKKEIHFMQELHHPCIVQFLGYSNDHAKGDLVILMEYLVNGSLEDYVLKHNKQITLEMKALWCHDMSQAMAYLHNKSPTFLIHRDVKPSNFMLTSTLRCKLGDFGISRMFNRVPDLPEISPEEAPLEKVEEGNEAEEDGSMNQIMSMLGMGRGEESDDSDLDQTGNVGTLRYMAPEVRSVAVESGGAATNANQLMNPLVGEVKEQEETARYSVQCDVFSLGMVFYFVFEGHAPHVMGAEDPISHFEHLENGKRPICKHSPPTVRRIIELCLRWVPTERPTSLELIRLIEGIPTHVAPKSTFKMGSKTTYLPVSAEKQATFRELEARIEARRDSGITKLSKINSSFNEDKTPPTSPASDTAPLSPFPKGSPEAEAAADGGGVGETALVTPTKDEFNDPALEMWSIGAGAGFSVEEGMLGQGKFGVVRLGEWHGTRVAVKCLFNNLNTAKVYKEIGLMQQLHHPCIVQFLGFTKNHAQGELVIVMEYLENGSLEGYIEKNFKTIPMAQKVKWCSDMASALSYLHNRKPTFLIHRDVKPSNFMLSASFTCKLGDFGISRFFDRVPDSELPKTASDRTKKPQPGSGGGGAAAEDGLVASSVAKITSLLGQINQVKAGEIDQTSNVGTLRYMAPEVRGVSADVKKVETKLELDSSTPQPDNKADQGPRTRYSVQVDIFSIGMVYYFVFEGTSPQINGAMDPFSHFANLAKGKRPICQLAPPVARRIIELCLRWEPEERPTSLELTKMIEAIPTEKVVSKVMGLKVGKESYAPVAPPKTRMFREIEANIEERRNALKKGGLS